MAGVQLGPAQSKERNLGWAIKSERQSYGADSTIHIETHTAELKPALNELLSQGGENHRADQRQANLASVRVAAQHQVNGLAGRMCLDIHRVIRRVAHQHNRLILYAANLLGNCSI